MYAHFGSFGTIIGPVHDAKKLLPPPVSAGLKPGGLEAPFTVPVAASDSAYCFDNNDPDLVDIGEVKVPKEAKKYSGGSADVWEGKSPSGLSYTVKHLPDRMSQHCAGVAKELHATFYKPEFAPLVPRGMDNPIIRPLAQASRVKDCVLHGLRRFHLTILPWYSHTLKDILLDPQCVPKRKAIIIVKSFFALALLQKALKHNNMMIVDARTDNILVQGDQVGVNLKLIPLSSNERRMEVLHFGQEVEYWLEKTINPQTNASRKEVTNHVYELLSQFEETKEFAQDVADYQLGENRYLEFIAAVKERMPKLYKGSESAISAYFKAPSPRSTASASHQGRKPELVEHVHADSARPRRAAQRPSIIEEDDDSDEVDPTTDDQSVAVGDPGWLRAVRKRPWLASFYEADNSAERDKVIQEAIRKISNRNKPRGKSARPPQQGQPQQPHSPAEVGDAAIRICRDFCAAGKFNSFIDIAENSNDPDARIRAGLWSLLIASICVKLGRGAYAAQLAILQIPAFRSQDFDNNKMGTLFGLLNEFTAPDDALPVPEAADKDN